MCGSELTIKQGRCASCGEPLLRETNENFETDAAIKAAKFYTRLAAFLWCCIALYCGAGALTVLSEGFRWSEPRSIFAAALVGSSSLVLIGTIGLLCWNIKLVTVGLVGQYVGTFAVLIYGTLQRGGLVKGFRFLIVLVLGILLGHTVLRRIRAA